MLPGENKFYVAFWVKIRDGRKGVRNIVRLLSPRVYNPFKISGIERLIKEDEGTIEFVISEKGNLFDNKFDHVVIFDLPAGDSRFILQREGFYELVFYRISTSYGFRVTRLNISKLKNSRGLHIFVVWSPKGDKLYAGDIERRVGLLGADSVNISTQVIKGKDGSYILIGDEGVDVRMVYVKIGKKIISEPSAIDLFNFSIEKVKILLQNCKGDFLFETTCVQAGIVLLVSGLEAYFKRRFIELEKEGWKSNVDTLFKTIFSSKYLESRKSEVIEKARSEKKSILNILVEKRYINFQNLDECKRVFNACYGLKFGEIFKEKPQLIEKVRKIIDYRHKIVHSGRDVTVINYEEVPDKPPMFASKQLLEEILKNIEEFINVFHKATLRVTKE